MIETAMLSSLGGSMYRQTQHRRTHGSTSWDTDGEGGPDRCVIHPKMTANDSTPRSGESLSEEPLPDELAETVACEVGEARQVLGYALAQDTTVGDVAVYTEEAKARLEYLLRQLEEREDDRDGGVSR